MVDRPMIFTIALPFRSIFTARYFLFGDGDHHAGIAHVHGVTPKSPISPKSNFMGPHQMSHDTGPTMALEIDLKLGRLVPGNSQASPTPLVTNFPIRATPSSSVGGNPSLQPPGRDLCTRGASHFGLTSIERHGMTNANGSAEFLFAGFS
jgi:hypothetical protein